MFRLSRPVLSRTLRVTIMDVYGRINNGFKEIAILACPT
jgi:hypothetical protein